MGGTTPEIHGTKVTGPALDELRWEVAGLLERPNNKFPGAQPVSFARRHIEELKRQDYFVCEKTDGIRCLMYFLQWEGEDVTYLIDRKNDYYQVDKIHFRKPTGEPHTSTILDGELVIDILPGKPPQRMYLVFDCMVLDGERLMKRTLDKRIAYFTKNVYEPYEKERAASSDEPADFVVDWKKMEFGYGTEKMFKDTLPRLPHGNDGLIFTCRTTPYQSGTDQHILKWKPAHENSVDFRMSFDFPMVEPDDSDDDKTPYPDYSAMPHFTLSVFGGSGTREEIPYGVMIVEAPLWESWKALGRPLNDQIVECSLIEGNKWRFLRFRDDKHEANHISVVESVMESIQDKVSEEDLIKASKAIRDAWKERERQAKILMTNGQNAAR